jgi:hypothetical protein
MRIGKLKKPVRSEGRCCNIWPAGQRCGLRGCDRGARSNVGKKIKCLKKNLPPCQFFEHFPLWEGGISYLNMNELTTSDSEQYCLLCLSVVL